MKLTCRECKKELPDHLPWCAVHIARMRMTPAERAQADSHDDVTQALMARVDALEKRLKNLELKVERDL